MEEPELEPEPKCSFWETDHDPEPLESIYSRLRQKIFPPKRLTYDVLGESLDELITSAKHSNQALPSFFEPLTKDDLVPPPDTTGSATNLLLTPSQN